MPLPEKSFKAGAVRAAVFRNSVTRPDGRKVQLGKVVLEVRYRDKAGQWRSTHSLSRNDLPKAVFVLQQAYAYLLENPEPPEPPETDDS